ncbi:MAG: serine/threonine protein kinase [Planctomycetaceae bacterium]|nr:serine/threonine protein kinase [Planctomycetaceae bacterium]
MNKDAKSQSLSVEEKLDATCDRFEAELKAGQTPQIEEFLYQTTGKTRSTLLSLLLQVEIELLSGKGKRPEPQSYHKRFPDHADAVTAAFAKWSTKRSVTTDTASQQQSPVETIAGRKTGSTGQEHPETLGRFQIQKVLGEGAMGAVYLAYDPKLKRKVALKVPKVTKESGPEILERFQREAQASATLNHRNICQVFDVDEENGQPYIAMAFVEGRPLNQFINRDKPIPQKTAAFLIRKIARALDHAHKNDVVHRDLKPANIMVDKEKEPVVTDFGLAFRTDNQQSRMTKDGTVMGTPAYMPIEQVNGELDRIGPVSDVYSLGIILFELLTGEIPFDGPVTAVIGQILTQEPPKPNDLRSGIDLPLEAICLKAIAKQIEDRYSSMAEFANALTGYLKGNKQSVEDLPSAKAPQGQTPSTATVAGEAGLAALFDAVAANDNPSATVVSKEKAVKTLDEEPASRKSIWQSLSQHWQSLHPIGKWSVGAGAATLLILMGIVLFFQTDKGTVKIEILDPSLTVTVADKVITIDNNGKELKFKVGPQKLLVDYEGLAIPFEDSFAIKKNETVVLRVTRIDGEVRVLREGEELPTRKWPTPDLCTTLSERIGVQVTRSVQQGAA